MVSDLEAFRAMCEHRDCGRILYYASFTEDLHKRVTEHCGEKGIQATYGFVEPRDIHLPRPGGRKAPDYSKYWENEGLPEGTTFTPEGVAMVPSGFYHFWEFVSPLRNATSLKEIEDYPIEDISDWDDSSLAAEVEATHTEGKISLGWTGHMYESAWQIRGYEHFLMDMIERPEWAECLLEKLFQQNLLRAKAFARAGVAWLKTGDDIANQNALMFSPDMWRQFIHSRWEKLYREVKDISPETRIWYHTDGNALDSIEDMVNAGLDILNPLQPECLDIDEVYRRYGDRISFDGCIGTQSTMPFGTPDDVRKRVKEVIEKYGRKGGLMISPTHILEPEVPLANIDAFAAACREYGAKA